MREARLVFHVPAERLEEGRDEVDSGLGLAIGLGEVMGRVSVEFGDELLEALRKHLDGSRQRVTPSTKKSLSPQSNGKQ